MGNYLSESLHKETDRYILGLMSPPADVVARMEEFALAKKFPFVGPLVGQLLGILARSCKASLIFEMGSGFGYSAVHFGLNIPEGGRVICTEHDDAYQQMAEGYFRETGLQDKIEYRVGDALKILAEQSDTFDIIFMDIEKSRYPEGFRAAWPKVKAGGLFIADNIFWHGLVFGNDQEPSTRGIREFTRLIYDTPDGRSSIIPLRDGVSITMKTS
jgi:predicted O-methyltransferase YrrM